MKTNLLKTLFAGLFLTVLTPLTASADVEINETNFPDENFRNWLLEQDYGQDGIITDEEIAGITFINVNGKSISSLKGIEHFTALTSLWCYNNQLTTLDVSKNTVLTELWCQQNQLVVLDVSKNTALTSLWCYNNQLTALDVSKNTALTTLYCSSNQLTALDVSNNTALTSLDCDSNQLTALDVSNNTALTTLYCYDNQIKGEAMDAFINSLPQNETSNTCSLYVYHDGGNDGNACTKSHVAAAKAKGWTPYGVTIDYREAYEYEGMNDEATVIALPEIENSAATVYTLHGQKVTAPQKGGIYIINGKKVVIK